MNNGLVTSVQVIVNSVNFLNLPDPIYQSPSHSTGTIDMIRPPYGPVTESFKQGTLWQWTVEQSLHLRSQGGV